jgi:cation:H+ antiporter
MLLTITGFIPCVSVIFYCGAKLAHYGDKIAQFTGMGKAWFGFIMMASVTSLPELFVGISAVSMAGSTDFVMGDVLASCVFNFSILSLLGIFSKKTTIFSIASQSHVLAAALGIAVLAFVGIGLFLPYGFQFMDWIGLISIVFIVIYMISIKLIYQYNKSHPSADQTSNTEAESGGDTLRSVVLWYSINALLVTGAALILPNFAEEISNHTGLQKSFTGTLLLAASTSLPEIAFSVAAIRMGAIDMAVGNLMGINLFNIFISAIDDAFYTKGNLVEDASGSNIISVFSIIAMTAIAIVGLTYRSKSKPLFFGLRHFSDSFALCI